MHPILVSRQRLALYLGAWFLAAVVLAASYSQATSAGILESLVVVVPLCTIYAFICLGAWYVCRATPLSPNNILQIFGVHFASAALSAGLWIPMWELWTAVLSTYPTFDRAVVHYRSLIILVLTTGVLLFLLAAMVHYLLIAFETSRFSETRELGLEVLAREAELKALRAQINPHFLFNSLNSISALTTTDHAGARRMCLLLADFFRSSLELGAKDRISLDEEVALTRNYLEIEKVRFGTRLNSEITLDAACRDCLVPPLILQPLVENSVRHGINSAVEGGTVAIAARCAAGHLTLSVENPVDHASPRRAGPGVGLVNVKLRLKTLFGSDASVQVSRKETGFRVELRFPCSFKEGTGAGHKKHMQDTKST